MKRTRHTSEQIISTLKMVDQWIAQSKTVDDLCRIPEGAQHAYHCWL